MRFPQSCLLSLILEEESRNSDGNHDGNQLHIVEPIGQHIECFIGGNPGQEDINSVPHHKDGGLEITGTEPYFLNVRQLFVIIQVSEGIQRNNVLLGWVLAADVLGIGGCCVGFRLVCLGAPGADQLAGQGVYFVLSGYD